MHPSQTILNETTYWSSVNYSQRSHHRAESFVFNDFLFLFGLCIMYMLCSLSQGCGFCRHGEEPPGVNSATVHQAEPDTDSDYDSDSEPLNIQLMIREDVESPQTNEGFIEESKPLTACSEPPPPDYDSISKFY